MGAQHTRLVVAEGKTIQVVEAGMIGDSHRVDGPLGDHFPYHEFAVLLDSGEGHSCDMRERNVHILADAVRSLRRMTAFSFACVDS